MIEFTCNSCGDRTRRIVNRLAYEKGTVFVQVFYLFVTYTLTKTVVFSCVKILVRIENPLLNRLIN